MLGADATPIINGYKMLKQTPLHASQEVSDHADSINARFFRSGRPNQTEQGSSRFKMPISAHREQLGHQIANEAQIRKREQKAQEKFRHYSKLGLAMQAQESVGGNKAASEVLPLKSPLSIRSGRSGVSSVMGAGSVKSLMSPGSVRSHKSIASNYSGRSRPSKREFSAAGQQLLQKLMKKK